MPVLIEEEIEELAVQIVMVGDVVAVTVYRQPALHLLAKYVSQRDDRIGEGCRLVEIIALDDGQHVENIALLHENATVHVHFAEFQPWVVKDGFFRSCISETDGRGLARAIAQNHLFTRRENDRQLAFLDKPAK